MVVCVGKRAKKPENRRIRRDMEQYKKEFIEFLAVLFWRLSQTSKNAVFTRLTALLQKSQKYRNLS